MAVIEELVSKLGFEVEGLGKLKAAAKQFDATKKAVIASSNPLKAAGASATVAAVGVGKLGDQSKKSSRGILLLSTALAGLRRAGAIAASALRTVLMIAIRLVGVFAGLAAGAAVVAAGFVAIGVKAALARREVRLAAAEIGTSAQNLETVGNIIKGAGFGVGFADEAKKVVGAIDEVAKTIRKGGDEADEAKKKFQGFGIDPSFNVDPRTGKSRDSAAIALDVFQAYKRATEQAANLRKQADALGSKAPKKAAALRKKAIEQDRKNDQLAEDSGISGRLKVLLDGMTAKQFDALASEISRLFPTTSNKEEGARAEVANQAVEAGLKFDALLQGLSERFKEIGTSLAGGFLPGLNSFLDSVIAFAKRTGIIKETVGERNARTEMEREANRASGLGRATDDDLKAAADRSQQRFEDSIKARSERIKKQISPEANAAKMQQQAEQKTDNRKYENIGNDQRTISPSINVQASGLDAVASAVKNAVLGAISTKGANTSTGALTAP
ncbi:MAG TPA: hypothetical protein VGN82_14210 [Bosea sp. (in: a-proteobacteria)]|jgi:hypothetical protein|uniref:hypothetical protein n=1 Tax=Bosea sp. (in: a-proteobacteria) TaxID=1871050 RepID=UPI002E153229|nr:hypothetical protein [Bosea sp. (in: a-proteobacteria)]